MKRLFLLLVVVVATGTYGWSKGWGILSFPDYPDSARDSVTKFNLVENERIDFIAGMQDENSSLPVRSSKFREMLPQWDAGIDWSNSRGTLQELWGQTLAESPTQGWPSIVVPPTYEEIMAMWPMMVPD